VALVRDARPDGAASSSRTLFDTARLILVGSPPRGPLSRNRL